MALRSTTIDLIPSVQLQSMGTRDQVNTLDFLRLSKLIAIQVS